ncbi:hypothetical protein Afil01_02580 [Actinorhabdospora filicis]|uniref:Uncharacterized protein n=1 Tax=Actinorhabdospora filicis TaxID=1785913 RepID=A0A9W6SHB2_9ACTN|nr:hypothetical protein [Actinorhabdospora filicis]GLZ75451.1 hypothetical protein Afil01_02580 [Actinorhabdospora filicis]
MKPGNVTTAQVILWIQGALTVVLALVLLGMSGQVDSSSGGIFLVFIVLALAQAALEIAAAVGLGAGRNWARILAIVVESIAIIVAGLNLLTSGGGASGGYLCGSLVGIGLAVTVIGCLAQESARDWCNQDA